MSSLRSPQIIVKATPHHINPPITDELLAVYENAIAACESPQMQDDLIVCLRAVKAWRDMPESTGERIPHPVGSGVIIRLDEEKREALRDLVPPVDEVKEMQRRFDPMPAGPLREAAFHFVAHLYQLSIGIEPFTTDKL